MEQENPKKPRNALIEVTKHSQINSKQTKNNKLSSVQADFTVPCEVKRRFPIKQQHTQRNPTTQTITLLLWDKRASFR